VTTRTFTVKDGRGREHKLDLVWDDFVCQMFYRLDGQRIFVDDALGWAYMSGMQVGDSVLRKSIDVVAGTAND